MSRVLRHAVTAFLLVLAWSGVWWALPLIVTIQTIAIECIGYLAYRMDRDQRNMTFPKV